MTTKQKQRQLRCLGFYTDLIDGAWGQLSADATEAFQGAFGLPVTGVFDKATEKMSMEIISNIQSSVGTDVDGCAGPDTESYIRKWQKAHGLQQTGIADAATREAMSGDVPTVDEPEEVPAEMPTQSNVWAEVKFFQRHEFRCNCGKYCDGYPVEMSPALVRNLEKMRIHFGRPMNINSGVRCRQHNIDEGGAGDSQHLYGHAADIRTIKGTTPAQMAAYAEKLYPNSGGIGVYSWGIHVDDRPNKARWVS